MGLEGRVRLSSEVGPISGGKKQEGVKSELCHTEQTPDSQPLPSPARRAFQALVPSEDTEAQRG